MSVEELQSLIYFYEIAYYVCIGLCALALIITIAIFIKYNILKILRSRLGIRQKDTFYGTTASVKSEEVKDSKLSMPIEDGSNPTTVLSIEQNEGSQSTSVLFGVQDDGSQFTTVLNTSQSYDLQDATAAEVSVADDIGFKDVREIILTEDLMKLTS